MSDELTQLRARVAQIHSMCVQANARTYSFLADEIRKIIESPPREADTKPLVDPADVEAIAAALTIANRKTDAFDAAWAAVSRIRQAL